MKYNVSRRTLLKTIAAAGLAGCGDGGEDAVSIPYADQPEGITPGLPRFYATAIDFAGYAQPVLAETHMGRPTKMEGNPDSAWSGGATNAIAQAACAVLYDPSRSRHIRTGSRPATWGEFADAVRGLPGPGLRVLTGTVTSPTMARQLAALTELGARWHVHEPVDNGVSRRASLQAFGRVLDTHWRLDRAGAVMAVDADPLGPGPDQVRHLRGWSAAQPDLLVAESSLTLTGAAATRRLTAAPHRLPVLVHAIAAQLGVLPRPPRLTQDEAAWTEAAIHALTRHAGRSLLAVGDGAGPEAVALAHAVNQAVGNAGRAVIHTDPVALVPPDGPDSFATLVADIQAGDVEALIILDSNPVYTGGPTIRAELDRVPVTIHAGLFDDETAQACQWHVPLAHSLEDWTDLRAPDGTATIVQPVIDPLYGAHRRHEILAAVLGEPRASARLIVMDTWRPILGEPFLPLWRNALHAGVVPKTQAPRVRIGALAPVPPAEAPPTGTTVLFRPDPHLWDGRYASVTLLQELPKPLTTLSWDAAALMSQEQAALLGVTQGDVVEITADQATIAAAAWIMPGQAPETVSLFLGHGRSALDLPGAAGYDAYRLRDPTSPWVRNGATLRRTGARIELATVQAHRDLAGHQGVIRTGAQPQADERPSLYPRWDYPGAAWGMVIDLDLCAGCNACMMACVAENNIPAVGRSEVAMGREMHWLKVDVYHDGDATHFQPRPCMHCEEAPCEMGCPVNATVHGPQGLNQMVYNRCIGTRTCSSYCPYKVRRFNFFDYAAAQPASHRWLRNPDVTVRTGGVMEKCTYCVQRIKQAERHGGAFTTACAQACPTGAIVFGDLNDPDSAVAKARSSPRNYALLGELGTRPRTTYLAKRQKG